VTQKIQNKITFSFIGITAYIFTDVVHEVMGHTGTAFVLGIHTTLLTSVYYRSNPGNFIVSLGGPTANLILAALLFFILRRKTNLSFHTSLFLLIALSYNLFWFSGTLLDSSFNRMGDWSYAVKMLNIGTFGKPLLILAGIIAYIVSFRIIRPHVAKMKERFPGYPLKHGIYFSYYAAVIAAVAAGLLFAPGRMHAALEGLLEMIASLPILFLRTKQDVKINHAIKRPPLVFYGMVGILFAVFCLTMGHGLFNI
jgi:hypothetical protein